MNNIKINYQKELEKLIKNIDENKTPTLLLHSCCGPCSSYCLEYLSEYFEVTIFYYNPNIYPSEEYFYRVEEQKRIIDLTKSKNPIHMIEGKYDVERFYEMVKGLEDMPEGGKRCYKCYDMRLREAAKTGKENGFDYFTTTLSISPHKNSQVLNKIGEKIAEEYEIPHLPSDFKKNNGYKRSCEITKKYGMYRQDYCGCEFSQRESEERNLRNEKQNLRKKMLELSKELEEDYMLSSDEKIVEKLLESQEYKKSEKIFCYVGRGSEINTSIFIEKALLDGKILAVPYCVDEKLMKAYKIESLDDLRPGKYDILEPDSSNSKEISKHDFDLIVVPCCTVDREGNRLGFGKGYYDRFLESTKAEKLLLIREKQIAEKVFVGEHDIKIKKIITEEKFYK
ncbi:MAG: 5-formyltetrahydrofolate cyclo-ligase [Peptostreptococcus sp.]|uniref:5-formyltetrahydrofolate cyclo-ligase n=1 Tax=Peptostreptococcus sp. TaxID=1262 RepID=UPI002FC8D3E4